MVAKCTMQSFSKGQVFCSVADYSIKLALSNNERQQSLCRAEPVKQGED